MSEHNEIVIIRRGGHGDHDEHHGGVWKIAFADFMTAMMAFFLVLWLISANDKTRASVARYFNPVRLVDATTQPRGLHDSKKDESGITASPDAKEVKGDKKPQTGDAQNTPKPAATGSAGKETPSGREKRLDAEMRDNPYVALAEIVGDKGPGEPIAKDGKAPIPAIGHGGAAFRDPFAPPPPQHIASLSQDDQDTILAPPQPMPPATPVAAMPKTDVTGETKNEAESSPSKSSSEAQTTHLSTALRALAGTQAGPDLDVRKTSEGTLVSLTDTSDFAMFSNGSAVPAKKVVLMMAKIATLLKDQRGDIVVRGFTDNKKFRSARYDNWHLSLDRAQVAHYMLLRGGLADARISHVEGYADHEQRSGMQPGDPRNRRIEILIKDGPA